MASLSIFTPLLVLLGIGILGALFLYWRYFKPLRPHETGSKYVFMEEDGSVRELSEDEKDHLNRQFHPNDGNRPYIKNRYKSVSSEGNMKGYIERRRVPKDINIDGFDISK